MAARATRSASREARATEAVATGPLGALSHDELGVIVDGLADPLQPVVAVALSSTCLGLRTPLQAVLGVLKERHERAAALCFKVKMSCAELLCAEELGYRAYNAGLTASDMATLGMILRTNGLPRLMQLSLFMQNIGDAGMQALCGGLGRGAAPSLQQVDFRKNELGPAGAEALAAALSKGAMPRLVRVQLSRNPIGKQGVAALAAPLRKLPAVESLSLGFCEIGDEGVTSLVANLGKDDFKKLEDLYLTGNQITDTGAATLVAALDVAGLPALDLLFWAGNRCSQTAYQVGDDALARAQARRASS